MSDSGLSRTVPTKRHLIPVLLAVALLVAGLAAPAVARATTEEVEASLTGLPFGELEREWMSGPMWHVRGLPVTWELDGDLSGEVALAHNLNQNQTTGQGTGFGSIAITTDETEWEGRYRGGYTDFRFAGTFVAHGSDGTVIRGTIAVTEPTPPPLAPNAELEGVILDPPGR